MRPAFYMQKIAGDVFIGSVIIPYKGLRHAHPSYQKNIASYISAYRSIRLRFRSSQHRVPIDER